MEDLYECRRFDLYAEKHRALGHISFENPCINEVDVLLQNAGVGAFFLLQTVHFFLSVTADGTGVYEEVRRHRRFPIANNALSELYNPGLPKLI
jgi:hypothetical protein